MKKSIRGHELGFSVAGAGPAVVLLHPFPFDRRTWEEVRAPLAEKHRVVELDFRGFGESAPSGPFTVAELAEDAVALLDDLGIAMATVVGLSMGGYVALAIMEHHAARVAGLVLADTRASADSEAGRQARQDGIQKVKSGGLSEFLDGMPVRMLSPGAPDALKRRVRTLSEQRADAVAEALAAMRDRPDRSALLSSFHVPALVMVGAADSVTPPSEARAMAAAIPGANFVELANAGHLAMLEQPAAFVAALAQFLDDNRL